MKVLMRSSMVILLTLATVQSNAICFAADITPQQKVADQVTNARLKLENEQALFNRRIEVEKLEVERMKAWITGASLMVPLMVAAITFALGVRNQNQQARLQREAQEANERAQFEIKAAELVMDANGPVGSKNKARALLQLFPNRLPADFVESFDPEDFTGPKVESYEAKKIFFEVASSHIKDIPSLVILWKQLFPTDTWPKRLDSESMAKSIVAGDVAPIGEAPRS